MRDEADREKIQAVIGALGKAATGPGKVYLVGGSSVVLEGLRNSTIDIDVKFDPEPAGIFESIRMLKDDLRVNIELAAPDQFIPELPGWKERSPFIERVGQVDFHHYDFYSQALAKLERGHERDLLDVESMLVRGIIDKEALQRHFDAIRGKLVRYPSINPDRFLKNVQRFVCP